MDKVEKYMHEADRFTSPEEIYQSIPGRDIKASRNLQDRWDAYQIPTQSLMGSILDIGCNIGGFSAYCQPFCRRYLGIDVFEKSILLARGLYPFANCSFEAMSFNDLEGEVFDTIFALAVRRYTKLDYFDFIKTCSEKITEGGYLFYESHTREKWGPRPKKAFESFFIINRVLTIPGTSHPDCPHNRFFVEMRKR